MNLWTFQIKNDHTNADQANCTNVCRALSPSPTFNKTIGQFRKLFPIKESDSQFLLSPAPYARESEKKDPLGESKYCIVFARHMRPIKVF